MCGQKWCKGFRVGPLEPSPCLDTTGHAEKCWEAARRAYCSHKPCGDKAMCLPRLREEGLGTPGYGNKQLRCQEMKVMGLWCIIRPKSHPNNAITSWVKNTGPAPVVQLCVRGLGWRVLPCPSCWRKSTWAHYVRSFKSYFLLVCWEKQEHVNAVPRLFIRSPLT